VSRIGISILIFSRHICAILMRLSTRQPKKDHDNSS